MGWEKSTPKHGQIYLIPNLGDWIAQQILAPPHSSVYLSSVDVALGVLPPPCAWVPGDFSKPPPLVPVPPLGGLTAQACHSAGL